MWTVREATADDADALGRVHVRAWQAAYRGIFSDAYLDGLDQTERANKWRDSFPRPADRRVLVVCDESGALVGFAMMGPDRDGLGIGELYAINLDPDAWGKQGGRALLEAAMRALAELGHHEAVLWVVRDNQRARRFYERAGWTADGAEARREVLGATADEVRYRVRLGSIAR